MGFTQVLLSFYLLLNHAIETLINFLKHMGDLGIDPGLAALEDRFRKFGEDKLFLRRVNGTCVCHGTAPVVENKFSLRINT